MEEMPRGADDRRLCADLFEKIHPQPAVVSFQRVTALVIG